MGTIAAMQAAALAVEAANVGYDQNERWTFFDREAGTLRPGREGDCSSVCGAIMRLGGFDVDLSGTFYTGNFADRARAVGFEVLPFTSLNDVRAGDFLLKPGHHVEFAYSPDRLYSAHIDENGHAIGGRAGDQTAHETSFGPAYDYRGGWVYIVRPPASAGEPSTTPPPIVNPNPSPAPTGGFDMATLPNVTLKKSSVHSEQIETIQALMQARGYYRGYKLDGLTGNGTLGEFDRFQRDTGCGTGPGGKTPDRDCGAKSWAALLGQKH